MHRKIYEQLKNVGKKGEASGGIAGGKAAIEAELAILRAEAIQPGSWLNDILIKVR